MFRLSIFVGFLILSCHIFAQHKVEISLIDTTYDRQFIKEFNLLYRLDHSDWKFKQVTNATKAVLQFDKGSILEVRASSLNFETVSDTIELGNRDTTIYLYTTKLPLMLREAVIVAQPEYAIDTVRLKIDSVATKNTLNLLEVISKNKDFDINEYGISYKGKLIENVIIDNDDISGNNYMGLLKTISASHIRDIDIIKNFTEQIAKTGFNDTKTVMRLNLKDKKLVTNFDGELCLSNAGIRKIQVGGVAFYDKVKFLAIANHTREAKSLISDRRFQYDRFLTGNYGYDDINLPSTGGGFLGQTFSKDYTVYPSADNGILQGLIRLSPYWAINIDLNVLDAKTLLSNEINYLLRIENEDYSFDQTMDNNYKINLIEPNIRLTYNGSKVYAQTHLSTVSFNSGINSFSTSTGALVDITNWSSHQNIKPVWGLEQNLTFRLNPNLIFETELSGRKIRSDNFSIVDATRNKLLYDSGYINVLNSHVDEFKVVSDVALKKGHSMWKVGGEISSENRTFNQFMPSVFNDYFRIDSLTELKRRRVLLFAQYQSGNKEKDKLYYEINGSVGSGLFENSNVGNSGAQYPILNVDQLLNLRISKFHSIRAKIQGGFDDRYFQSIVPGGFPVSYFTYYQNNLETINRARLLFNLTYNYFRLDRHVKWVAMYQYENYPGNFATAARQYLDYSVISNIFEPSLFTFGNVKCTVNGLINSVDFDVELHGGKYKSAYVTNFEKQVNSFNFLTAKNSIHIKNKIGSLTLDNSLSATRNNSQYLSYKFIQTQFVSKAKLELGNLNSKSRGNIELQYFDLGRLSSKVWMLDASIDRTFGSHLRISFFGLNLLDQKIYRLASVAERAFTVMSYPFNRIQVGIRLNYNLY